MRGIALAAFGLLAIPLPAMAEDVFFSGDVDAGCTVLGHLDGSLGMDLTSSGSILTSELPYGAPATVTILSTGTNYVNVSAPTLTAQGAGYSTTGQALEVKYLGAGTLNTVSQAWTDVGTSKAGTSLLGAVVTVDNRITNTTSGFPTGTYTTKTVVTCTPTAQF